jgi:hypothetical protein
MVIGELDWRRRRDPPPEIRAAEYGELRVASTDAAPISGWNRRRHISDLAVLSAAPMIMKRTCSLAAAPMLVIALAVAATPSASVAQTSPCTSIYTYRPLETPLTVSPDLTVRLRNPYGAQVNIGRYFVQFRIVYAANADRAKVSAVQWELDGHPNQWKRGGGRDGYLFGSFHLTEGPHIIDVTITPAGGSPVTGHIAFNATRCEPMSFAAEAEQRKQPGHQPFAFWVYTGATPMREVDLGSTGARVSTAPALRGTKVGELRLGATPNTAVALRLPSTWRDPGAIPLLHRGALRVVLHATRTRFLTITGLPAQNSSNISLSFGGPRGFAVLPSHAYGPAQAGIPGLIGTRRRCQPITWDAWVFGPTGDAVHATSRQPLARECRR